MTATLFLFYVVLMASIVIGASQYYLPRTKRIVVSIGLATWLFYVGLLGWFGILTPVAGQPPGVLLVFIPLVLFIAAILARSAAGLNYALAFPLWLLLSLQVFRVCVEIFLHQFWIEHLAPKLLTFEGANIDILFGITAPLIAWIATTGRNGLRVALLWNILGLCSLANVIGRSVLSAPGPLNVFPGDLPNLLPGTFPFVFLSGFFAPLAISLHVLAIRSIRKSLRNMNEQRWLASPGAVS